ncbi:MAG: 4Fe-4S dicluster domain-containing protein [Candidatus Methanomethylicia archaeon]
MGNVSRRGFLKILCTAPILLLTSKIFTESIKIGSEASGIDSKNNVFPKYAMVIDLSKCIGCRICMYACIKENNIGRNSGFSYIKVYALPRGILDIDVGDECYSETEEGKWYIPVQCMQCDDPPCVKVCPVGATFKLETGVVWIDHRRCIGCRLCMAACPYNARRFNWVWPQVPEGELNPNALPPRPAGVVEKCIFCPHRVTRGLKPRCVVECPTGARYFGDLNDPESEVSKLIRENVSFRLREDLGYKPRIYYINRGSK